MAVSIRPLVERDALTSVKWRNNPEIWRLTASSPDREISLDDELEWIRTVTRRSNERRYAIEHDAVYVGNIYLTDIDASSAEYHIFIGDTRYQGKGIARSASLLILDVARDELHLDFVELQVKSANERAVALYRGLGFIPVSTRVDPIKMRLIL